MSESAAQAGGAGRGDSHPGEKDVLLMEAAYVGVTLVFLQQLLAEESFEPHYATHEVVSNCVVPFLRSNPKCKQDTYVLGHQRPWPQNPAFGAATVFVSHAWRCNFVALVSALERRASDRQATAGHEAAATDFFWLDVFSKDQFSVNSGHTMAQLKAVVETCDTFVLIMDPWDSPVCFTRVWCLFEVLTAILSGRAIEVALPTAQIIDFIQDLCSNGYERMNNLLASIDARRGDATVATDKDMIHGLITNSVGFDRMNKVVVAELRRQMASLSLTAARSKEASGGSSSPSSAIAKVRACELLLQLGDTAAARTVATEALANLGETDEIGPGGGRDEGGRDEGGRDGGAKDGPQKGPRKRARKGAPSGPRDHVLAALSVLARVNENEKRHEEAIDLFRKCLDGYCEQEPSGSGDEGRFGRGRLSELALEASRRLGYTLTAAGRAAEGTVFLQWAVDGWAERAAAEKSAEKAASASSAALATGSDGSGQPTPETLKAGSASGPNEYAINAILARRGLSEAQRETGDVEKAAAGYRWVMRQFGARAGYGPNHRRTLAAAHGLGATLLLCLGDAALAEARRLLEATVATQALRLGAAHGDTLKTRFDLARALARAADGRGAVAQLEEAVRDGWRGGWYSKQLDMQAGAAGDFAFLKGDAEFATRFAAVRDAARGHA